MHPKSGRYLRGSGGLSKRGTRIMKIKRDIGAEILQSIKDCIFNAY